MAQNKVLMLTVATTIATGGRFGSWLCENAIEIKGRRMAFPLSQCFLSNIPPA